MPRQTSTTVGVPQGRVDFAAASSDLSRSFCDAGAMPYLHNPSSLLSCK